MDRVNITLDPFSLFILETLCKQSGMNRSEIIRKIIRIYSEEKLTAEEIEKIELAAAMKIMESKKS